MHADWQLQRMFKIVRSARAAKATATENDLYRSCMLVMYIMIHLGFFILLR